MGFADVQGTQIYVLDVPTTEWADCDTAITAIIAGDKAECFQDLGEITRSRDVTEESCIDKEETSVSLGSIKYGELSIKLKFDNDDTKGQSRFVEAMNNNTPIIFAVENSDKVIDPDAIASVASGTIIWTKAAVFGDGIGYPTGSKVEYNVSIKPYGGVNRCASVAGKA